MVMGVYEPRGDDLIRAVDDLDMRRWINEDGLVNLDNDIALNQEVCDAGYHVIILIMYQERPTAEEN